eukprot:362044-Chlamydomonas_euryale.AAC.11
MCGRPSGLSGPSGTSKLEALDVWETLRALRTLRTSKLEVLGAPFDFSVCAASPYVPIQEKISPGFEDPCCNPEVLTDVGPYTERHIPNSTLRPSPSMKQAFDLCCIGRVGFWQGS